MGIYSEYLDKQFGFLDLVAERKKQLNRISQIRGRAILVFAADFDKANAPISINFSDLLPINDQLSQLTGSAVDIILQTPGGSGEAAEDIVKAVRNKFNDVAFIIPGWAKSAGTIIAMSGDEILMDESSALGPIDAQLFWQGKVFSADALLEGFERIKSEVEKTGILNKAYVPILQAISPGELQNAENAQKFAEELVTKWLAKYKFKNWATHSSTGKPVTEEDRKKRAKEIARVLRNHSKWLSHGRSIKLQDFNEMKLKITDFSQTPDLNDAIQRYYTLLQMTFGTNIYKVYETPASQIYKHLAPMVPPPSKLFEQARTVELDVQCTNCKQVSKLQANLEKGVSLKEGYHPFPKDNKFKCPKCSAEIDLSDARRQIEAQSKKEVVE